MSIIREWFASLHEMLDGLIDRYPGASDEERSGLREQWRMLKRVSDEVVESWLQFEDKLAVFRELDQKMPDAPPEMAPESFLKGQGYFKLHMFSQAAACLEQCVKEHPDLLVARLYLAMSQMHLQQWTEAQRHFQLVAVLAEDARMQAIAYNALGCIMAVFAQLEQAQAWFHKALQADPTFQDPRHNLDCCRQGGEELHLQFGSAALQAKA
jgi:tetratricopeptide (TPR) repeat protein